MTEQLHRLIDSGANQPVINERMAGLLEGSKKELERVGTDHEKRIRYLERTVNYALGGIGLVGGIIELLQFLKK